MKTIDLSTVSTEELEQVLAEKKKENAARNAAKKKAYEAERDALVEELCNSAIHQSKLLAEFKEFCQEKFDKQYEQLEEYGTLRANSKGGFALVTSCGRFKAVRNRATQPSWDERSNKAITLITEFLETTIRKRDKKLFEILFSFIKKNEKGELEYSRVMNLLQHQDKYNDPRWVEGLNLIKESYSCNLRGYQYDFFQKDKEEKWERINLQFSSL
jgi:hypothetical protein